MSNGVQTDEFPLATPPEAPVVPFNEAPVIKPSDHPRLELGLSFWKPLLKIVGWAVVSLVAVMAINEWYTSYYMGELYAQALTLSAASGSSIDSEKLRALQALIGDARESQQAFRAAWQQAAQLILVNLLLPVLTALLGYIFGVQQGRASEAAEQRH